jgi:acetoin utilization protein AcuB
MLVGKRMTRNPITLTPEVPINDALALMREKNARRMPVVNKLGKLVGVVTYNDLMHASPSPVTSLSMWEVTYLLSKVTVQEVMKKSIVTATEDMPLEEAACLIAERRISCLPVMRGDELVGIITETDIFQVFLELMSAREKAVRLTVFAPNVKGSLAQISSAIYSHGGFILTLNIFLGHDPSTWGCHLKVTDISKDDLVQAVTPYVVEIEDVREI